MTSILDKLLAEKRGLIGERRIRKMVSNTRTIERLAGKPLDTALNNMDDVHAIAESIAAPGKYTPATQSDLRLMLKLLWKAAQGYETEDRPKEVRWLKVGVKRKDRKHPKRISEEELKKMLKVAGVRDRAILQLLYETGLRPSELTALKKSDLEFVKEGVRIHVPEGTKTGARDILAGGNAEPALANWINAHPIKKHDAILFPSEYGTGNFRQMCVENLNKMVRTTAEKAGIPRKLKTYDFRHTAASINAKFFSEAQLRQYMGWTQDSQMAAVYVALSGRDTDDGVARKHNKPVIEAHEKPQVEPKKCRRCDKINMHDAEMCAYCGLSFDKEKAKSDMMSVMERLKKLEAAQKIRLVDDAIRAKLKKG